MESAGAAGPRAALGLAQVATAGLLWGTGGLVATVLHDEDGLGAMTASAWRMVIAAAALLVVALVLGRGQALLSLARRPGLPLLVGVGTAAYQGLYFLAVLAAGVSVATVIALGLAPVLATAWEQARARAAPSGRRVLVLAAALVGLVLVAAASGHAGAPGSDPAVGVLLAVASGATYAATTVLGHHVAGDTDPIVLTTGATTAGAVVLAPFLLVAALGDGPVGTTRPGGVALLVYLGVATMALAYGLLYSGLRTTPGSAATIATLVEPLSAAVLAVVLLDERLGVTAVVGGVLILLAVVGTRPQPPVPVDP